MDANMKFIFSISVHRLWPANFYLPHFVSIGLTNHKKPPFGGYVISAL